jgi:ATP-binding cassette subfamily B protein
VIVVRTLSRVLFFTPGRLVEYQVKNELFAKLLALQPSFYSKWKAGDIVSRTSDDMTFVRVMIGFGMLQIFNTSTALLLTGGQMFRLSAKLTLLLLIPIVISLAIVQIGIRRLFDMMKASREQMSAISDHVLSSIHGVQTIQGFRAEEPFTARFKERNEQFLHTNLTLARITSFLLPLLGLGGAICVWALLAIGGPMTIRHELTVGQLVAFTTYIAYLLMPLRSLGWMMSVFQRGQTSLERVLELLDATPERPEGNSPSPFRGDGVEIEAKHLTFAYPDEPEEPILHDISFTIPNGKRIGIFGRTGSGKSTLLRLFTRIYNPPPGTLFVNGVDVTTLDLHEWRDKMAVVPQTPFLFSDTIESNISVGVSSGADTKAAIKDAIVRAAFDQDLDSLTEGMDTIVGERGIMLSGGQRQRITLARALARECEFLVLDDVLSAVDHNTERRLIQTIEEMSQTPDRCGTVVLVSHRLSALASSDWILVLEEGKLVDQGTHEDLTQRPGPYREAWLHQADQAETNEGGTEA